MRASELKTRFEGMQVNRGATAAAKELQASAAAGQKALVQLQEAEAASAAARGDLAQAMRDMQGVFETAKGELQEDLMQRMRAALTG